MTMKNNKNPTSQNDQIRLKSSGDSWLIFHIILVCWLPNLTAACNNESDANYSLSNQQVLFLTHILREFTNLRQALLWEINQHSLTWQRWKHYGFFPSFSTLCHTVTSSAIIIIMLHSLSLAHPGSCSLLLLTAAFQHSSCYVLYWHLSTCLILLHVLSHFAWEESVHQAPLCF